MVRKSWLLRQPYMAILHLRFVLLMTGIAGPLYADSFLYAGHYYRPATEVLDHNSVVYQADQHRLAGRWRNLPVQVMEWSRTYQMNGFLHMFPGPAIPRNGILYLPVTTEVTEDPQQWLFWEGNEMSDSGLDRRIPEPVTDTGPPISFRVFLDPGHGGADSGAVGIGSIAEKEITLAIALAAAEELARVPNVHVLLSRKDDSYPSLNERTEAAARWQADLLVSIHCNSAPRSSATGVELYVVGQISSDRQAERVAQYENEFVEKMGDNPSGTLGMILADLSQNDATQRSVIAAREILREVEPVWGGESRGVRQAPFWVLRNATMPSVLVEVGFISNSVEAEKLTSPITRRSYGILLARAIINAARAILP